MAKGTDFGGIHSHHDLNLIQQKLDIQPAKPKLNLIDVPGADGSVDMSELPGGRVVYGDRTLTWIYALYPGDNWHDKHHEVSNALNGRRCKIVLDDDPELYYTGRLIVKQYSTDKALRQITVEAICNPWILKQQPTVVTHTFKNTTPNNVILTNEKKPTVPTITLSHEATIYWGNSQTRIPAGTYSSLDIELQPGENLLQVSFPGGTGTITITYQEGSL